MKILAVANRIAVLEALEKELKEAFPGSEIVQETDVLMAGKYAFNQGVDIVFAEANMKRMNGLQMIRFVRQEHPGVISFLVGTEQELSEARLPAAEEVTGILTYPFAKGAIQAAYQRSRQ